MFKLYVHYTDASLAKQYSEMAVDTCISINIVMSDLRNYYFIETRLDVSRPANVDTLFAFKLHLQL